jgi:hypothetical protein
VSYDERQLGELLRLLPAVPEHLLARAKELPQHFGDEADADAGGDDRDDETDAPRFHEDDAAPPPETDAGGDAFQEDDRPDGELG